MVPGGKQSKAAGNDEPWNDRASVGAVGNTKQKMKLQVMGTAINDKPLAIEKERFCYHRYMDSFPIAQGI